MKVYSQTLVDNQICLSSQKTYENAWLQWTKFCDVNRIHPTKITPLPNCNIINTNNPFNVDAILGYMANMYFYEQLTPPTIKVYLSGIAYKLNISNLDTSFLHHKLILGARNGIQNIFNKSKRAKSKFPFTLDLIEIMSEKIVQMKTVCGLAIVVAALTAYLLVLRVSEYLFYKDNTHYLKSEDVVFICTDINTKREIDVCSMDIHKFELDSVNEIVITINSTKNDQKGIGKVRSFTKNNSIKFCIVKMHYRWCVMVKPKIGQPYFSYQNKWFLKSSELADAMKKTADIAKLNRESITTHSLRHGGATAVATNFETTLIKSYGGWKSDSFLGYVRITPKVTNQIAQSLLNTDTAVSYKSIKRITKK